MKVKEETTSVWTLPNRLSVVRILFIPLIIIFIATQEEEFLLASSLLFIVAGITDGLDGYVARKMSLTTKLGLYLDPIADKLLVSSVLITLTYYRFVPLWVTITLIAREFLINGLRSFYSMEGTAIYPSFSGKLKTTLQIVGIALILFNHSLHRPFLFDNPLQEPGMVVMYVALFLSIYSAVRYITAILKPSKNSEK